MSDYTGQVRIPQRISLGLFLFQHNKGSGKLDCHCLIYAHISIKLQPELSEKHRLASF